jgi:hypothetical protein
MMERVTKRLAFFGIVSLLLGGCGSRYGGIPRDPSLGPKTPVAPAPAGEAPKPKPAPTGGNPR